jgi:hypothetical protein
LSGYSEPDKPDQKPANYHFIEPVCGFRLTPLIAASAIVCGPWSDPEELRLFQKAGVLKRWCTITLVTFFTKKGKGIVFCDCLVEMHRKSIHPRKTAHK